MDNFINDLEKQEEKDNTSQMKNFILNTKTPVPDFVTKTKEWLLEHPEQFKEIMPFIRSTDLKSIVIGYVMDHPNSIPEMINEQYPDLRAHLNNLGVVERSFVEMASKKFPVLGGLIEAIKQGKTDTSDEQLDVQSLLDRAVNGSGSKNSAQDRQVPEEAPDNSSEGIGEIPEEIYDEAIDWAYGRYIKKVPISVICDSIFAKYGFEVNAIQLGKQLKSMELAGYVPSALQANQEEIEEEVDTAVDKDKIRGLKVLTDTLAENKRLRAEKAEREQAEKINRLVEEKIKGLIPNEIKETVKDTDKKVGVIRKLARWIY